jgi:DNA-binding transcriptional MerR regulator
MQPSGARAYVPAFEIIRRNNVVLALDFECALTNRLIAMTTFLTIQQAAAATGLTVHTLRYYERIGLIDPIPRQDNKRRHYRDEDIQWITFLTKLRSTGLPVRQMLRYAELRRQGDSKESVSERKALLEQHTHSLETALLELQSTLGIMHKKIALYDDIQARLQHGAATKPFEKDASRERTNQHTNINPNPNEHPPLGR